MMTLPADLPIERLLPADLNRAEVTSQNVADWIRQPCDSPALSVSVTPDDRVVLVVDAELPEPAKFVGPIIQELAAADINSDQITILFTGQPRLFEAYRQAFDALDPELRISVHDDGPTCPRTYLASTEDGRRVYLNALVNDADLVITVGLARLDPIVGIHAGGSFLFPTLSDADALSMAQRIAGETLRSSRELRRRQGCDEVAWLLGTHFTMAAFADRAGRIVTGKFGEQAAVLEHSRRHLEYQHGISAKVTSDKLFVGTILKAYELTTWKDIGSALHAMVSCAEPGCELVLLTDLAEKPPTDLQASIADADRFSTWAKHRQHHEHGSLLILQIIAALTKHKVYLYSRLPAEDVESAGMVAIASPSELHHLLRRKRNVVLVEDAIHLCLMASANTMPAPADDQDERRSATKKQARSTTGPTSSKKKPTARKKK